MTLLSTLLHTPPLGLFELVGAMLMLLPLGVRR
jgi:hypothetical protein